MPKTMNKLIEDTKVPTIMLIGVWVIGVMLTPFALPLYSSKYFKLIMARRTHRGTGHGATFIRAIYRAKTRRAPC